MSLNKIFTDLEPKKLINIGQKWAIPATVHWPDSGQKLGHLGSAFLILSHCRFSPQPIPLGFSFSKTEGEKINPQKGQTISEIPLKFK